MDAVELVFFYFLWENLILITKPCVIAARTLYSYHRSTLPQFVFVDWHAPLQNAIWVTINCVAVKVFNLSYLLTSKMTFGQNPGPKMFSKSLIMLFSPWVNLGDWEQFLYRWDASIFPHLPVEEDDKGVDLLDLLLQELHQLLHSLTIALNIISKAWLDLDRKQLTDLITNLNLDFGLSSAWSVNNCYRFLVVAIPPEPIRVTKLHLIFTALFAHLSLPWSIGWVALSFFVHCSYRHGDIQINLHIFQYIQA